MKFAVLVSAEALSGAFGGLLEGAITDGLEGVREITDGGGCSWFKGL